MSGASIIYVPCDVVQVHVMIGYGDTLSPMEEMTLRAVHAGLNEAPQLAERLGLGRRLVHDLVYDLWRQGHLSMDPSGRVVEVSPKVARCLERGDLAELKGGEAFQEARDVMIDKLSGRVLPAYGRNRPAERRLAVPAEQRPTRLEDAPQEAVLRALSESLARDEENYDLPTDRTHGPVVGHRARRVLSYRLPPPGLRKAVGRRWIELKVVPHWDELSDQLAIDVIDDKVPAHLREGMAEQLNQLAAEMPHSPVFRELRERAKGGLPDPPSAERALARLERRVESIAETPAGQRRSRHRELADDARQLAELVNDRIRREIKATCVTTRDQARLLPELIARAQHQIVIVSPWISANALEEVYEALAERAARGVRIAFLWGANAEGDYESWLKIDVRNRLEHLQRTVSSGSGRNILVPRTSARTHAKLLVVDDHTALVTSRNLLSSDGRNVEIGMLLETADLGKPSVINDLLTWTQTAVPTYDQSQQILALPEHFAAVRGRQTAVVQDHEPESAPVHDIEPPGEDTATGAAVRLWSEAWKQHLVHTRSFLAGRELPAARVITDATHRALLMTALDKATRRLVIASHGLSEEVVDTGFLGLLRGCLERGVEVTIVHGEREDAAPRGNRATARTGLETLQRDFPTLLRLPRSPNNHAKVLVWDDEVIVGSFNYLSFEGRYGRMRLASELSVRLSGGKVADRIAALLGAKQRAVVVKQPVKAAPVLTSAFTAAQRLLDTYTSGGIPSRDAVRAALEQLPDPWPVLEALGEDAPALLVRVVAAHCLLIDPDASGAARWHAWLVRSCWEAGEFVEAAVLRRSLADEAFRPRLPVAVVAAAKETPAFGKAVEDLALQVLTGDASAEEGTIALLAVVGLVLLHGTEADTLEALVPEGDSLWRELARRVLDYWGKSYQPIPLDLVRGDLGGIRRARAQDAAWQKLERLFDHAAGTVFAHTLSTRTHKALFESAEGEFALLGRIIKERSVGPLRTWIADLPQLAQLIRMAAQRANPGQPPMDGMHLKAFLRYLEQVVDQVRVVLDLADEIEDGAKSTPVVLEGMEQLADWLADHWVGLTEEIASMEGPERRIAVELLDDLQDLSRWGSR